jgi:hypothetical protein
MMQVRIANNPNTKVDIAFDNSLQSVKFLLGLQILLHAIQCLTMISMIFIDIKVFEHKS